MVNIVFQQPDGETEKVDIPEGNSLMEGAVRNGIAGIDADCGGALACATCHVHLDAQWREKIAPPEPAETDMLEFAVDVDESSRLSCQIMVTSSLEGMVVHVPATQIPS